MKIKNGYNPVPPGFNLVGFTGKTKIIARVKCYQIKLRATEKNWGGKFAEHCSWIPKDCVEN